MRYFNRCRWRKAVETFLARCGADTCICCGEPVPEGRMVCPNCEKGVSG